MKHCIGLLVVTSACMLAGCATPLPTPEQYGFRHVSINAKDYYCAPPEWVIPPVVPALWVKSADLSGDIPSGLFGTEYPKTREICLTQEQWPKWLMLRTKLDRVWPISPGTAASIATP